ncbi:MAG: tetratricopeptide repeat protein, partial [Proteobacteria bacterium]|nr:tetratricopeptide repeat protein [Pseudomonadota bacterium]
MLAAALTMTLPVSLASVSREPAGDPRLDAGVCEVAAAANDAEAIVAKCGAVIDNVKMTKADRVNALMARAGVFARWGQDDRALADYSVAVMLDPMQADAFNNRGEIFLRKGDRPRALADFGAALKLDPRHGPARDNYRSLVRELERIGAQMPLKN